MLQNTTAKKTELKIAVPYYGALVRPKAGFERLFLVGSIAGSGSRVEKLEVCLWDDHKKPNIADWFQEIGITGVICSDGSTGLEKTFADEGIWLKTGVVGEACDLMTEFASVSI